MEVVGKPSLAVCMRIFFIATTCLVDLDVALNTTPNVPWPILSASVYSWSKREQPLNLWYVDSNFLFLLFSSLESFMKVVSQRAHVMVAEFDFSNFNRWAISL